MLTVSGVPGVPLILTMMVTKTRRGVTLMVSMLLGHLTMARRSRVPFQSELTWFLLRLLLVILMVTVPMILLGVIKVLVKIQPGRRTVSFPWDRLLTP